VTGYGRPSGWRRPCGGLALGQILALLLLVPRAAAAAISAGPTIDVPWMQSVNDFADVTVVVSDQCSVADPSLPCVRGMQMFDDAVTPRTPFISADVAQDTGPGGVGNSSFSAAIGPQGQVLLTWFTDEQLPVPRYVARLYDQYGSPASDEVEVVTPAVPDLSPIRGAKALDDGSFVLAWLLYTQVDHMATLFVDRFDPQTKRYEEPVALAEGAMAGALLELNGAGKGVVVWQTEELDADGSVAAKAGHLRVIQVNR